MNSRRSFLRTIGLGFLVAPALAKAAMAPRQALRCTSLTLHEPVEYGVRAPQQFLRGDSALIHLGPHAPTPATPGTLWCRSPDMLDHVYMDGKWIPLFNLRLV